MAEWSNGRPAIPQEEGFVTVTSEGPRFLQVPVLACHILGLARVKSGVRRSLWGDP